MNESTIPASPLNYKIFQRFLATRFTFILAMQITTFAIAWYIYELTKDKLALGLLGLSEITPAIGLALYAGHVVDKSDKRTLFLRNVIFYLFAVVALFVVCGPAAKNGLSNKWIEYSIYFIIFCTGIFRAFIGPTQNSIVSQLVHPSHLPKAITFSTTAWQTASVIGPIVAGLLISFVGISNTFLVAVCLLILAIFFIYGVNKLPVANTNATKRTWDSVKEGLHFVWNTKTLLSAASVDLFAVFFGGATAMLPVYAKDILHVDATGMGILKAAQGVGTVLILFYLSKNPLKKKQGNTMLHCVALFGICIIVFAISKSFWISFAALFFSGIFDGISVVVRGTIQQLFVPNEMRGRVSSVNSMFINSSNELGQFESGLAAKLMGTVPSVLFGGCMTLMVVVIAWVKAKSLRKMEY